MIIFFQLLLCICFLFGINLSSYWLMWVYYLSNAKNLILFVYLIFYSVRYSSTQCYRQLFCLKGYSNPLIFVSVFQFYFAGILYKNYGFLFKWHCILNQGSKWWYSLINPANYSIPQKGVSGLFFSLHSLMFPKYFLSQKEVSLLLKHTIYTQKTSNLFSSHMVLY